MNRRFSLAASVLAIGAAMTLAAQTMTMQQPNRDAGSAPLVGTGEISGLVMSDESVPRPVRRASVQVANDNRSITRTAVTNDAGVYTFERLPPGRYTLSATKPAFIRAAYGAKRYDRPGTPITLGAAQKVTGLILKMARGGVIAGTIADENGRPSPGTPVRVLQFRTQNGERTLAPVATIGSALGETTDDRGMYRIYGLPPGEYVVTASPRLVGGSDVRQMTPEEIQKVMKALQQPPAPAAPPGAANAAPNTPLAPDPNAVTVGYAPVFYPGTTTAATAGTVSLGPGEERTGVNFRVQLVRTARVRGTVSAPTGINPQTVQLMIVESGQVAMPGMSFVNMSSPGPDGKFTFNGLTPGQYTITARTTAGGGRGMGMGRAGDFVMGMPPGGGGTGGGAGANANAPAPTPLWAMVDLSINGQDQNDVMLSLQPGMTVAGRLAFDGVTPPPQDLSRARVSLMPPPSQSGSMVMMGTPGATIGQAGDFKITGVTPGKYSVSASIFVQGSLAEWTVKSVMAKGRDVLDTPLEIGPNEDVPNMVVTFTDQSQRVSGALQDASGRPAPDFTIVVFPADKRLWNGPARRIRTTRPATDGQYTITGLPAGDYRIAAVTDMAPADANDPSFLEQLATASFAFTLKDGEKKVQDLKIAG